MAIQSLRVNRRTVLAGIGAATGVIAAPGLIRAQTRPDKVVIGALCSLSGPAAAFGTSAKNAIEVRVDEVNKAGGLWGDGKGMIELVMSDDQSKAEIAVSELARFGRAKETVGVVSLIPSGNMMQATIEAERQGLVMVNAGSVVAEINERGLRYTFTTSNNTDGYVRAYLEYTREIVNAGPKPAKVALIHENKFAGPGYKAAWDRVYSDTVDWAPADIHSYDPAQTDFGPLVSQLKADGVDFPVLSTYPQDTILLIRAMREQNYNPLAISGFYGALPTVEVVTALGKDAEFIMGQAPYLYDMQTPGNPEFVAAFKAKIGQEPDPLAGLSYNAISGLLVALRNCSDVNDRDAVRDAMATLDVKVGTDNVVIPDAITITEKGSNPSSNGGYYQIRSGVLKAVRPAEFASTQELIYPRPSWDKYPG